MSGLEVMMAVAGILVTLMVVVGMVLLTPRNVERSARAAHDGDGDARERTVSRAGSGPTGRRPPTPRR